MWADRIGQIVDAIDEMDSLSKEAEVLQTMLFSAQEMKIDSDGRMLPLSSLPLPADNGLFAGIGRSWVWRPTDIKPREDARQQTGRGVPPDPGDRAQETADVGAQGRMPAYIPVMLDESPQRST